eukprot:scaffold583998_cov13-Prasinocladus_malaysianus.AAC.1
MPSLRPPQPARPTQSTKGVKPKRLSATQLWPKPATDIFSCQKRRSILALERILLWRRRKKSLCVDEGAKGLNGMVTPIQSETLVPESD